MALPRVQLIRPKLEKHPFDDDAYLFELKYDGFRAALCIDRGEAYFTSRSGLRFNRRRFDLFAAQLAGELALESALFDGELIAQDETGRPVFSHLLRDEGHLRYVAFDLLFLNDGDIRPAPLSARRARLGREVPEKGGLMLPVGVEGEGTKLFELVRKHDLEGMVAKRVDEPYGLWAHWYKIKNPDYSQKNQRPNFNRGRDSAV